MAKWENFTADRVESFKCPPGKKQAIYWDGKTPGLGLRVTSAGAKSYIFEGWLHGKSLRITIGNSTSWTLGKAQKEARQLKTLIDKDIDPRVERANLLEKLAEEQAKVKRYETTVQDAWTEYLKARKPKWSERTYEDHCTMVSPGGEIKRSGKGETAPGPLAALMTVRLKDLTASTISSWLQEESLARPTRAALSYRMLRAFIRWTADAPEYKGLIPEGSYSSRTVRESVPKVKPKDGDSLQREQLPSWFGAVRQLHNPIISAYLQSLLLTGARREEMATLRWEDVDFQWRSLTIRDKVEGTRIIPLTPYVAGLLAPLPRRNEWVFSSPASEDGRLAEPRTAHVEALTKAGLPHITIHGLRRSFGTLCEWVEVPSGISAQIMGHKPSAIAEKHYRRRPLDLLRKWHDIIEAWILEQAGVQFEPAQPGLRVVQTA